MRSGIIGGSFNPVHYGHLRVAEEVREVMGLDRVVFMPAFIPPHKQTDSIIAPKHRLEMLRISTRNNPFFIISDMEVQKGGHSYSVETLRTLTREGNWGEIFFIMGADSFNDITSWYRYKELFEISNIIVASRQGYPERSLAEVLEPEVAASFSIGHEPGVFQSRNGFSVNFVATSLIGISASKIRNIAKKKRSLRYLTDPEVEKYIERHQLYQ